MEQKQRVRLRYRDRAGFRRRAADLEGFRAYVEMKLNRVEKSLNREQLRDIFLHIYGNPVAVMLDR